MKQKDSLYPAWRCYQDKSHCTDIEDRRLHQKHVYAGVQLSLKASNHPRIRIISIQSVLVPIGMVYNVLAHKRVWLSIKLIFHIQHQVRMKLLIVEKGTVQIPQSSTSCQRECRYEFCAQSNFQNFNCTKRILRSFLSNSYRSMIVLKLVPLMKCLV